MNLKPGIMLALGLSLIVVNVVYLIQMRMAPIVQIPAATVAEATEAVKARRKLNQDQWAVLRQEAEAGNPAAMNVLGVALRRNRETRDQAQALFERDAELGEVGARYNLAVILPDKFDTDPAIIKKRLELLQANVAHGDIPSMVELGNSLYYVNRDAFVQDRETLQHKLYAQAADTGDADYLVIYGKALWKDIRGGADPARVNPALAALKAAYEAGDPRGAETIGSILEGRTGGVIPAISPDWTERDPLIWYRHAGDMGLATARCALGLAVFRTGDWVRTADMSLIERHFRAGPVILGNAHETVQRAMDDLEHCATSPKRKRRSNPPFGNETLYLYKQHGTYTSMSTQPGWANMTLGVLYGYGIGVERDRDRALGYLDIAANRENFTIATEVAATLPDFSDGKSLPEPQ
jgi:TPR repeat protein